MALYKRGGIFHYDFAVAGKRYRGSSKQATLTKARLVESRLIADAQAGTLPDRKAPMLRDVGERFIEWVDEETRLRKNGRRYYKNGWRLLKDTRLAQMRMDEITNDDVVALGPSGPAASVNNAIRTLRRIFGKAVEWKMVRAAPKISTIEEHGRTAVIDEDTEKRLLAVAPQPLRDVLTIIMDTGMRPSEVFAMRWDEIAWQGREVFVPTGKTRNSRRSVPMSDRVLDALMTRKALAAKAKPSPWVFPARNKQSPSGHVTTVAKQWAVARTACGLPADLVPYCARHTFGTTLYEQTGNLAVLMKVMGHGDVKTTMRYQHPEIDIAREAINRRNVERLEQKEGRVM